MLCAATSNTVTEPDPAASTDLILVLFHDFLLSKEPLLHWQSISKWLPSRVAYEIRGRTGLIRIGNVAIRAGFWRQWWRRRWFHHLVSISVPHRWRLTLFHLDTVKAGSAYDPQRHSSTQHSSTPSPTRQQQCHTSSLLTQRRSQMTRIDSLSLEIRTRSITVWMEQIPHSVTSRVMVAGIINAT